MKRKNLTLRWIKDFHWYKNKQKPENDFNFMNENDSKIRTIKNILGYCIWNFGEILFIDDWLMPYLIKLNK